MLLYTIVVFLFGLSSSFLFLLVLVAFAGLAGSTFHPATYSLVAEKASREHITKSVAYHQFGGFFGGAIGVALVGFLAQYLGWRHAVQILVIPGLIVVALFWFVVQETKVEGGGKQKIAKETKKDRDKFKITPPLLLIILFGFISPFGGGMGRFLPMFISLEYGESIAWAGILTGVMQAVGCLGIIIGGAVADKFDKVWIISAFTTLTGISTIVLATGYFSSKLLLIVLVFRGFVQYFPGPARQALTAIVSESSPKGIGLWFSSAALGRIFGNPLAGYLIDVYGMRSAFLTLSVFTFLSGAVILLLKKWSSYYVTPKTTKIP